MAEYFFSETENINSLPIIDQPIRVVGNDVIMNPYQMDENRKMIQKQQLNNLQPIENLAISLLSQQKNVIIDEYDLHALLQIMIALFENQSILILSDKQILESLQEIWLLVLKNRTLLI